MVPQNRPVPPPVGTQAVGETLALESLVSSTAHSARPQKSASPSSRRDSEGEYRRELEVNKVQSRREPRSPSINRDADAVPPKHFRDANLVRSLKLIEPSGDLGTDVNGNLSYSDEEGGKGDYSDVGQAEALAVLFPVQPDFGTPPGVLGMPTSVPTSSPIEVGEVSGAGDGDDVPFHAADDPVTSLGRVTIPDPSAFSWSATMDEAWSRGAGDTFVDLIPAQLARVGPADGIRAKAGEGESSSKSSDLFPLRDASGLPSGPQVRDRVEEPIAQGAGSQSDASPVEALSENLASQAMRDSASADSKNPQNINKEHVATDNQSGGTLHALGGVQSMISARSFVSEVAVDPARADFSRRVSSAHVVGEVLAVREGFAASGSNRCVVDFDVDGHGNLRVEIIRRADHLEAVLRTDSEFLRDSLRSAFGSAEGLRSPLPTVSEQKSDAGANGTDLSGRDRGGDPRRQNPTAPQSEVRFPAAAAAGKREPDAVMVGSGVAERLLHTFA